MLSRRLLVSARQSAFRPPAARIPSRAPSPPISAESISFSKLRPNSRRPGAPSVLLPLPGGPRLYTEDPRFRNARPLFSNGQLRRIVRSPSTHTIIVAAVVAACIFYFSNLETVPVSGRTRFNCYSAESVREVGESQAKMVLYDLERNGGRILPDWDPR